MPEIKERPILFQAPMVRAILAGEKTVTRRAIRTKLTDRFDEPRGDGDVHAGYPFVECNGDYRSAVCFCPYGQPGDRLWVRETTEVDEQSSPVVRLARYAADRQPVIYRHPEGDEYDGVVAHWDYPRRSRPSIHMPRWASRILLEITSVRVERLRDTKDLDLLGDIGDMFEDTNTLAYREFSRIERLQSAGAPLKMIPEMYGYRAWWDKDNGQGSFDSNPWVWVFEFKRVMP